MSTKFLATVHILLDAENEGEAADTVSAALTERGIYEEESGIIDWSYVMTDGRFVHPRKITVPDNYDRDEVTLAVLARES